jgi:hypothetical protein
MLILMAAVFSGCGGMPATLFIHPEFDFGYVERVAVIPLENLTGEQGAGSRATRFFLAELLATEAFVVIEPGEVTRVLSKHATVRTADLTQEQIVSIGRDLNVQGLFFGSVNETSSRRSGSNSEHVVSLVVRLVETDTGETVWSAAHTEGGRSFWSKLFGTGGKSQSEVMRKCVEEALSTLMD